MPESTFDSVDPDELPDEIIRCPECGYDLHGIIDRRRSFCPECGLPFSTRRLKERLLKRQERRARLKKIGWRIATAAVALAIVLSLGLCQLTSTP